MMDAERIIGYILKNAPALEDITGENIKSFYMQDQPILHHALAELSYEPDLKENVLAALKALSRKLDLNDFPLVLERPETTLYWYAIKLNLPDVERFLIEVGLTPPRPIPEGYTSLFEYLSDKKQSILSKRPVYSEEIDSENIVTSILSRTFFENDNPEFQKFLYQELTNLVEPATILKPMLALASLAAQGRLSTPQLSICYVSQKTLNEFELIEDELDRPGSYESTSCTILFAEEKNQRDALATLLHEMSHMAMYVFFRNRGNPYDKLKEDKECIDFLNYCAELEKQFRSPEELIEDERSRDQEDRLKKFFEVEKLSEHSKEFNCGLTFNEIFNGYPETSYHKELIVKVPEIIGTFGLIEGEKILRMHFKELVTYYELVNKKIQSHVEDLKKDMEFLASWESLKFSDYSFFNHSIEEEASKQEVSNTDNVSPRN